jgi:hypothetical protein
MRRVLKDFIILIGLGLTSRAHLAAENLFLRKQLAVLRKNPIRAQIQTGKHACR